MSIDLIPNEVLMQVIREPNKYSWNFSAAKIMLARLNLRLSFFPDNFDVDENCNEVRRLFKKCQNIPNAQKDLQQLSELMISQD